jgi:hypothetical protein
MRSAQLRRRMAIAIAFVTVLALLAGNAFAGAQPAGSGQDAGPRPVVSSADANVGTSLLKDTFPLYSKYSYLYEIPRKWLPNRTNPAQPEAPDPNLQDAPLSPNVINPLVSFEGVHNFNGVLPPDPTGDIGPNHYVQAVNLAFAIYDRKGNKLYGPADINTLFAGMGGACQTSNDGDPIVLYDQLADRWLISQFALPSYPRGPFYQCIAISQTPDPTQSWYRYQFTVSNSKMNDYPKFGVWPDGYYMSVNQFNQGRLTWGGQGVVVFERDKMLQGQTARMVYFDLYNTDANLGGMLPADWDGATQPPAGAPNPFTIVDDDAWGYSPDQLQIWNFKVDWTTPASSTFTRVGTLVVNGFDSNMCGGSRNCIPQPGGTKVDAIADRLMYRTQYRNFGTHQTLVLNHTVDVNSADLAGVRWYELRNSGSGWSIFQQGTYSLLDGTQRWMGSIAMNGAGQIALGYSASGTSLYPSVKFTGRLPYDPPGQMTQGENTIVAGAGFQTHSSGRWGDYSQMSVDPTDDCTFWYTQEYYNTPNSSAGWQTRIGSFKLADCSSMPVDNPPTVKLISPAEGATVSGTVTVDADPSDDNGVTKVEFFVDDVRFAEDTNGADGWSTSWSTSTATDAAHQVKAVATDTANQTGQDVKNVTVQNAAPSNVLHVGDLDGVGVSQNSLRWQANVTITVHDSLHQPVSGASVSGAWSAGATGTATCTTGTNGTCTVSKGALTKRTVASVTFTVNNVTKSGSAYNSNLNHDEDAGTNGTVITVARP